MNNIKVPYLPISNFDASDISKNFSESTPTSESKELDYDIILSDDEEDELSQNIILILIGMGMRKYIKLFQKQRILFDTFIHLNDADLQELGITDPEDREIITKNLSVHKKNKNDCAVPENQIEDLQIVNNVYNQLLLMQKYSAYVELQMRKHKLTDYVVEDNESASMYLKAFTEAALIQTHILKQAIYDGPDVDAVITKIIKENNLTLPKAMKTSLENLQKKKKGKNSLTRRIISVIGVSVILIVLGKYFTHSLHFL